MHRTTWIALPVIGVLAVGAGVGVWTHNLVQERSALASETEAQYAGAFHGLVADMQEITERLGEAQVSSEPSGTRAIAADVWRLSYGAQLEVSRLPLQLMPMHNTQAYLASLSSQAATWMLHPESLAKAQGQTTLQHYYTESKQLNDQLARVQTEVLNKGLGWLSAEKAAQNPKGDNQIVNGFQTMDGKLASFTEAAEVSKQTSAPESRVAPAGKPISGPEAISRVVRWTGLAAQKDWRATPSRLGGRTPIYIVTGSSHLGPIRATVSQRGGNVLDFHIDAKPQNDQYGFAEAEDRAKNWASQRGYNRLDVERATQYDHTGYYVMVPWRAGGWVVDAPISVYVALDTGNVIGYDGRSSFVRALPTTAPTRVFSESALRAKLNPQLHVESARPVVLHDTSGMVHSAWEFLGTHDDETYRVTMDAHDGTQLSVEQLQ
ncbi:MAG: germination protein YpeB [Alicyclobacillus sp.]|nr:germination protein YpeB [Alicyclobacillus sp.]